jgi:hypothetical protein
MRQKVSPSPRLERDSVNALAQRLPKHRKPERRFAVLWSGNSLSTFETGMLWNEVVLKCEGSVLCLVAMSTKRHQNCRPISFFFWCTGICIPRHKVL